MWFNELRDNAVFDGESLHLIFVWADFGTLLADVLEENPARNSGSNKSPAYCWKRVADKQKQSNDNRLRHQTGTVVTSGSYPFSVHVFFGDRFELVISNREWEGLFALLT